MNYKSLLYLYLTLNSNVDQIIEKDLVILNRKIKRLLKF